MEKLKQYYDEHKNLVRWGVGVGCLAGVIMVARRADGNRISTVDYLHRDGGGSAVVVWKKNGKNMIFTKSATIRAAVEEAVT